MLSQPKMPQETWRSIHLYTDNVYGRSSDDLLEQLVRPTIEDLYGRHLIDRWFFVRYFDVAPHIRLRLKSRSTQLKEMEDRLYAHLGVESPAVTSPRTVDSARATFRWEWSDYSPEYRRYGAGPAMETAEEFFKTSSECVIEHISDYVSRSRAAKIGVGFRATALILRIANASPSAAAEMARRYFQGYLTYITGSNNDRRRRTIQSCDALYSAQRPLLADALNSVWNDMEAGDSLGKLIGALGRLRGSAETAIASGAFLGFKQPIVDWADYVRNVVPSHIHMNNNRIGLSISDEVFVTYSIARVATETGVL